MEEIVLCFLDFSYLFQLRKATKFVVACVVLNKFCAVVYFQVANAPFEKIDRLDYRNGSKESRRGNLSSGVTL